jgi:AcrR family transcriptional regulator
MTFEPTDRRSRARKGPAIARHLARDDEILRIAARVFRANGLHGTRLDDIADAAGIRKATLYHYFSSKDEIVSRLFAEIQGLLDVEESVAVAETPLAQLERMVRHRVELVAGHPAEMGILMRHLTGMDNEIGDWARLQGKRNGAALRAIIEVGQRDGSIRPGDPNLMAEFATGAVRALSDWYRPEDGPDARTVVDELTGFIMSAMASPRAGI